MVTDVLKAEPGVNALPARRWQVGGTLTWMAVAAALAVLVVYPLSWLVIRALSPAEAAGGVFTLANFVTAFTTERYLTAIRNSVILAASVGLLDLVLAVPMAWAVVRTDMPLKGLVRASVVGAFITPGFLGAIAWTLLASPRAGWLNKGWMALTGAESGLLNIYSMTGLVFIVSLYTYPYAFLFTTTSFELMSSEMEDAAAILGARTWRIMRAVTFPLVLPGIVAGFIMAFLEAMADLGAPLLISVPARFQVITTQLFQFFQFPSKVEVAAAYSIPLLLVTGGLLFVQRRLLARKAFATLTGKGGAQRTIQLGRWRYVALAWCLGVATLSLFLPGLTLLSAATAKAWARGWSSHNFTLDNFRFILFEHPTTPRAILNSFMFSTAAATAAVLIAFFAAYIANRRLVRGGWVLGYVAMMPYVIPGIVLAIGFLAAYARPPFALYGTAWILIFAFTSRFLPIAYANSDAALKNIHPELEDAARISGAGRFVTLSEVTLPLIKRGILGGWLLVLIAGLRELSTAIFLFSANTKVMSTVMIDLSEEGDFERLAALGVIMFVLTLGLVLIGYSIVGQRILTRTE